MLALSFGVTRDELIDVVRAVVGARADAVDDDPATAEGLFAYIFGTRHLRAILCSKGWLRHRTENIESAKHPTRHLKLVYQSVDVAASLQRAPRAVSGKGADADRIIDSAQGSLFTDEELARGHFTVRGPINSGVWFFCVSVNGDDVRAELSLPSAIKGSNFFEFLERIFILRYGDWPDFALRRSLPLEVADFDPKVTRK